MLYFALAEAVCIACFFVYRSVLHSLPVVRWYRKQAEAATAAAAAGRPDALGGLADAKPTAGGPAAWGGNGQQHQGEQQGKEQQQQQLTHGHDDGELEMVSLIPPAPPTCGAGAGPARPPSRALAGFSGMVRAQLSAFLFIAKGCIQKDIWLHGCGMYSTHLACDLPAEPLLASLVADTRGATRGG